MHSLRQFFCSFFRCAVLLALGTGLGTAGCDFGEYSSGKKKKSTKLAGGIQDNALPRFTREKMAATVNSECREPFPQKFVSWQKNRFRSTLDMGAGGNCDTDALPRFPREKMGATVNSEC